MPVQTCRTNTHQNGGHLQTQMSVDIDYVVIATADSAASAPIAEEAKAMHIPILNPTRLSINRNTVPLARD
jgi:hypothetical protein